MKIKSIATIVATLALSAPAGAHEAGEVILRVGAMHYSPDVTSGRLHEKTGNRWGYMVWRDKVDIDADTNVGLSATWMVIPHLGIEFATGAPFSLKVRDKTAHYDVGKVKAFSPTVSAQFFFMPPQSRFQPYVGLEMNYTAFYDESIDSDLRNNYDGHGFKVTDSLGLAMQTGIDFAVTDRFVLNAALWKLDVYSKIKYKEGNSSLSWKADVDPWQFFFGIGYKF
ncbi:MAG: hypothetical protein LBR05_09845 [Azoarcus sp.]|jgi:outer membrane protein|nr:hypothetical protein [Azoarcus sp.]